MIAQYRALEAFETSLAHLYHCSAYGILIPTIAEDSPLPPEPSTSEPSQEEDITTQEQPEIVVEAPPSEIISYRGYLHSTNSQSIPGPFLNTSINTAPTSFTGPASAGLLPSDSITSILEQLDRQANQESQPNHPIPPEASTSRPKYRSPTPPNFTSKRLRKASQ